MSKRGYSLLDTALSTVQEGLETLFTPAIAHRPIPVSDTINDDLLSDSDKHYSARLMRINHAGEVCAQALYRGQALTARDAAVRASMRWAAEEEADHLAWCATRLEELGSHTSYLNPFWYVHSFMLGAVAGAIGDKWSLGFIEATEQQVTAHLQAHLDVIAPQDEKSRAILQQMKVDEAAHAVQAQQAGAAELPGVVKQLMACTAKVMTTTTYWL